MLNVFQHEEMIFSLVIFICLSPESTVKRWKTMCTLIWKWRKTKIRLNQLIFIMPRRLTPLYFLCTALMKNFRFPFFLPCASPLAANLLCRLFVRYLFALSLKWKRQNKEETKSKKKSHNHQTQLKVYSIDIMSMSFRLYTCGRTVNGEQEKHRNIMVFRARTANIKPITFGERTFLCSTWNICCYAIRSSIHWTHFKFYEVFGTSKRCFRLTFCAKMRFIIHLAKH